MDLVGIMMRDCRAKTKVVMLTQIDGTAFTPRETSILCARLKPMAIIQSHPKHPTVLLIQGGPWSEDDVAQILGHRRFEHEIVEGIDNPKLPWKPGL